MEQGAVGGVKSRGPAGIRLPRCHVMQPCAQPRPTHPAHPHLIPSAPAPLSFPPFPRFASQVSYRLNTVRVELYNSYDDDVRFGLEIVLSMWIFAMLLWNLWEIAYTQVGRRGAGGRGSPGIRCLLRHVAPGSLCVCVRFNPQLYCKVCRFPPALAPPGPLRVWARFP